MSCNQACAAYEQVLETLLRGHVSLTLHNLAMPIVCCCELATLPCALRGTQACSAAEGACHTNAGSVQLHPLCVRAPPPMRACSTPCVHAPCVRAPTQTCVLHVCALLPMHALPHASVQLHPMHACSAVGVGHRDLFCELPPRRAPGQNIRAECSVQVRPGRTACLQLLATLKKNCAHPLLLCPTRLCTKHLSTTCPPMLHASELVFNLPHHSLEDPNPHLMVRQVERQLKQKSKDPWMKGQAS